jgi:hypothetical protein
MDHLKLQASARQRASDYIHARARNRIDKQSSTLGDATSAPSRACHGISAGWPQPTERGARVLTIRGVGEGRGGGEQGAEHRHGEEVARRRHSNPSRAHPANPPRGILGRLGQSGARTGAGKPRTLWTLPVNRALPAPFEFLPQFRADPRDRARITYQIADWRNRAAVAGRIARRGLRNDAGASEMVRVLGFCRWFDSDGGLRFWEGKQEGTKECGGRAVVTAREARLNAPRWRTASTSMSSNMCHVTHVSGLRPCLALFGSGTKVYTMGVFTPRKVDEKLL